MFKKFSLLTTLGMFWLISTPVIAQAEDRLVANDSQGCIIIGQGVPSLGCLSQVIQNVISVAFIFLGAVCLIFLMFGAIKFIFSRGDPKAIQKAKGTITYAIMGTIFVVLSFAAVELITHMLGIKTDLLQNFGIFQGP